MQTTARADSFSWFNSAGSTTMVLRKKSSPPGSQTSQTKRPPRPARLSILTPTPPQLSEIHPRAIRPSSLWSGERKRPTLRVQPTEIFTDHGPIASYSSQSSASPPSPLTIQAPTRTCPTCSRPAGRQVSFRPILNPSVQGPRSLDSSLVVTPRARPPS